MNGKGRIRRVSDWNGLADELHKTMSEFRFPVCDLMRDSIFTTQIEKDRWFFLNTSSKPSVIKIIFPDSTHNASISPNTITDVDLSKISK
jgi:hypothetical protein